MSDQEKVLEAEQFRIIDRSGRVRAVFGMDEDAASPSLRLFRQDGTVGVSVGFSNSHNPHAKEEALPERPLIDLHDDRGVVRLRLMVIEDEYVRPQYPSVQLYDQEGMARIYLTVTPDSEGQVIVKDSFGNGNVITPGD